MEELITPGEAVTLYGLFLERLRRTPKKTAYLAYDRRNEGWQDLSWADMGEQVARWQAALQSEGFEPGDRAAIQLRNCPEWVIFDQAVMGTGLVTVPLYTDDRPDNVAYILEESAARLLLIQDAGRWKRLSAALPADGPLRCVVLLEDSEQARALAEEDERVVVADGWLPDYTPGLLPRGEDPHALASIIYTSGTTGRPKGVMLSHYNMLSVAAGGGGMVDLRQGGSRADVFMSFLPLSHTLERTVSYYLPMMCGAAVAYARSVAQLAADLQMVRPTAMIAVPRVFERVYGRIMDQLGGKPAIARWLFHTAVAVGWRHFLWRQGRRRWGPSMLFNPLLHRLVGRKIAERLGGRLRVAVSGGAALCPEVARVFIGLGVPLLQGYGLTETSPVISVNTMENNHPDTVGLPLPGVEVRVGDDDELQVKTPGAMLGYWNNHTATAEVIDVDGWLHTGDQAVIEDSGHIRITGRIKDILVLSNGEKVPPGDMEGAIALDPLFEQVLVLGEGRPFLSALIVLNADIWPSMAADHGLDPDDPDSVQAAPVSAEALRRIRAALSDFPGYAKIRRVYLMLEPWTVDNGLITPTLKIKRAQVLARFAAHIDALYEDAPDR